MSAYVAALATAIAIFVMLRAERKDLAKDFSRVDGRLEALDTKLSARLEALDSKMTARIEALDTKLSARLDTVVLELGKAFGRPAS